jgi:hypothetical protein
MMALNRFIKSMAMLGVDLLLLLESAFLSLFIASPVVCIAWCFISALCPSFPMGFWAFWLTAVGVCTVPMFIRIMVKAYWLTHNKKKKGEGEEE